MDESNSESLATSRAKRQKLDRKGRFAALQKLRDLKGSKYKYEVNDVDNVYDEVDEKEYTKKVLKRQEEDWIIDDDGCGYVEDGREIFDDDLDGDAMFYDSRKGKDSKRKKRSDRSKDSGSSKSSNIKNMLMNMPTKKRKEGPVKLDEDDILGDIMQELHKEPSLVIKPKMPSLKRDTFSLSPSGSALRTYSRAPAPSVSLKPKTIANQRPPMDRDVGANGDTLEDSLIEFEASQCKQEPKEENDLIEDFDTSDFLDSNVIDEMEIDEAFSQPMPKELVETKPSSTVSVSSHKTDSGTKPASQHQNVLNAAAIAELASGWESMQGSESNITTSIPDVHVDPSKLPLTTTKENEQVLRFFWWDAYEDPFKHPGVVYLFGKVWIESASTHVSCCVTVKNIDRRIYMLPRETHFDQKTKSDTGKPVTFLDVYTEFNSKVTEKYKISQFKSRRITKNYAFEITDVPTTSEYLEVMYSANLPAIPSDCSGETFSHVFGTTTSSLELLLVDRKIKGPCWLDIKNPQPSNPAVSWCKVEAVALKPDNVNVSACTSPPPPLVVMTLNMRTTVNVKTCQSEIAMIGILLHNKFHVDKAPPKIPYNQHFCAITRPSDEPWPFDHKEKFLKYTGTKLEKMDSERALLGFFLAKIHKLDPDIVVGHDVFGYDLEVLVHRINANKIPHWSRLGRLKRGNVPVGRTKGFVEKIAMCGRLVCDVKISAKELIRARSYDLGTLCQQVLRIKEDERIEVSTEEVKSYYSTGTNLLQLVNFTMQDASYIVRLMCELNVLPLVLQITNIAGNVMSRTLMGGRSERNEFLLLHAFTEKNFIVPDKQYKKVTKKEDVNEDEDGEFMSKKKKGRKKPQYTGGLVLDPKKGFYDTYILLMDFNSLYPSIIQEYNICFTTIPRTSFKDAEGEESEIPVELPDSSLEPGILPTEIRKLVESRREVKKLMKAPDLSSDLKLQYNIRQMALKLTANSMYGCLGFSHSRFYAKPLAALVTAKGREILMNTKDLVQKMSFEVIYGDTDSIMINTRINDYDEVFKVGNKIKAEVNKLYRQVELDIDGVFKYMLLLKKKKYAAVTISRRPDGQLVLEEELKGLDIVRRDWSQLSAEAGRLVLKQILSDQSPDERIENIHAHLEHLKGELENGNVPLSLLAITKQLTKNADEYVDKKSLPHVQVAMRLNSRGGKKLKAGDAVSYVICEDGSNLAATQRAYHIDELKHNESLKIDVNYYLSQQIHPVVSRLCDPIEGTDAARIAECLGLDPTPYRQALNQAEDEDATIREKSVLLDEDRFKYCDKFKFKCMNEQCGEEITMDGPFRKDDEKLVKLEKCPNPNCTVPPVQYLPNIQNRLTLAMRAYIHQYYKGWLMCEDPGCPNRIRRIPLRFSRGYPICNVCEKGVMFKEYTDSQLYTQLSYFQRIFEVPKEQEKKMSSDALKAYQKLREQVERVLRSSAYSVVNLSKLFEGLFPKDVKKMPNIKVEKER